MKVAISATGPNLQADVDPRFGRCQYLIFVDTDTMAFEAQNNANINAGGGAGIATAQAVADHGVQAVITGNMGPKAHKVLSQAGINIFAGASGTVEKAIEDYKNNRLKEASSATVEEHAGMSPPPKKTGFIVFRDAQRDRNAQRASQHHETATR